MEDVFNESRVLLKCAILPVSLGAPMDAIKLQLNEMLLKYNDELQGIPITFSRIEYDRGKELGRIMAEQPHIHIDITTTVLLFKPAADKIIYGKINQTSDSHISLLVYGIFNASIASDQLGKGYKFNHSTQEWESAEGNLSLGSFVQCTIINFNVANGVLSINATKKRKVETGEKERENNREKEKVKR